MLSIIIPAYNEEKRLPKTIEDICSFLDREQIQSEVLVVDDGSKDKTAEVVEDLSKKYSNLRVISYAKNKGKGGAVKTGVMLASGDFIVFLDADNSTPIAEIKRIIEKLNQGYDMVIGSRKTQGAKILKPQPMIRRILGNGFNLFIKIILGLSDYSDTQCGFKGFQKNIAKNIFSKTKITGFAFDTELLCIAQNLNYKVLEMPVSWRDEQESTLKLKSVWNIFLDVCRIKYNFLKGDYGRKTIFDNIFLKDLIVAIVLIEIAGLLALSFLKNIVILPYPEFIILASSPIIIVFVFFCARVLSQRIYEFVKFLVAGALNTVLDFAVLNYLCFVFNVFSGELIVLFNLVSFSLAVINSYFLNKFWTFKKQGRSNLAELFSFLAVSIVANLINTTLVFLGTTFLKHVVSDYLWLNFIKFIAILISTIFNFLGYKFFVFKKVGKSK